MDALVELITSPNGSLAYHLVIAFTLLGALQSVLNQTDERAAEARGRMALGLGALLALRGTLFLASGLAIQGISSLALLLPLIDRVLGVLSVLAVVWLWTFSQPSRTGDAATLLAGAAVALAGALSGLYWASNGQAGMLNESGLSLFWEGLALALVIAGELVLLGRRPENWGTGLTLLLLLFVGILLQLIAPNPGDVPAYIRMAQLAAFPLLFTLPRRLILPPERGVYREPETRPAEREKQDQPPAEAESEKPKEPAAPAGLQAAEFRAIVEMAATDKPEDVCRLLTRHLGRALVSDITLLLTPPDHTGQVIVMCGYDLIREDSIGGAMLDQRIIPGYPEAMKRGRPLQIPDSDKLDPLAKSLSIKQTGHLLVLPLANDEGKPLAAIVLFSPYSKRAWTAQDQRYVKEAAPLISQLLQKTQRGLRMRENLLAAEAQLKDATEERERLAEEHRAALAELDVLRAELEKSGNSAEAAALREELQALRAQVSAGAATAAAEELEALAQENGRLRKELESFERLKKAAQAVAAERDRLKSQVKELQAAVPAAPGSDAEPGLSGEQAEVIASIAQDLRQPMSSIIGYTDLLLSESVGILGALQRKFLDRVKASTERMNSLVDNLIQITALDSGNVHITPETVDLTALIDHSISETSGQIREKNIALRVDLADDLPRMHTDKDAVQQILTHLLSNAGAATPVEGEIALRARADRVNGGPPSVLVEVADSGEGIPEEDMPRVFSRLYRADNPLIQGVGDTGVGLSIAKTLAEALGGEIWVESQLGKGSTFRVRLPVETRPVNGPPGGAPE